MEGDQDDADCLHDLAWIYDERGAFEKAIEFYERAQESTRQKGLSEDPALAYNLACSLAKGGKQAEALETLKRVIKETWKWAEEDPDFKELRESADWGNRFRDMLSSAKTQS
jgi:tetratricopeptide (TPR) repeat protein